MPEPWQLGSALTNDAGKLCDNSFSTVFAPPSHPPLLLTCLEMNSSPVWMELSLTRRLVRAVSRYDQRPGQASGACPDCVTVNPWL